MKAKWNFFSNAIFIVEWYHQKFPHNKNFLYTIHANKQHDLYMVQTLVKSMSWWSINSSRHAYAQTVQGVLLVPHWARAQIENLAVRKASMKSSSEEEEPRQEEAIEFTAPGEEKAGK